MLHELLRNAARRWPNRLAIDFGKDAVTYAELDRRSDQLAAALVARGCERGDRVAILCQKSIESYVAIYGILKAGCAYVPLDRRAPLLRLGSILDDCEVKVIVISSATAPVAESLAGVAHSIQFAVSCTATRDQLSTLALLDRAELDASAAELPRVDFVDTDLAYILYTSGSTGSPKGVMISHLNATSFVRWASEHAGIKPGERVSGHAPLHFDLSIFDIFATARMGGVLVPVPDGASTFPSRLSDWIRDNRISIWYSVPSALVLMAQQTTFGAARFPELRLLVFAGEVFPAKFLSAWLQKLPGATFMNWYGPTETNVITSYTIRPGSTVAQPVPIGQACTNVNVYLIDEEGNKVRGVGCEGELCARGSFVALGYWGDRDKTASSFHFDPLLQDRTYRTGDIARMNDHGEYEYLGRRDHMVKIRGYRIELGEIEAAIYRIAGVQEAAVIPVPDEAIGITLIACVSAATPGSSEDWVETAMPELSRRVPTYMMPVRMLMFGELPKTSTGKIDRQSLLKELRGATEGRTNERCFEQDHEFHCKASAARP